MGYYTTLTPGGFVLRQMVDIDWDRHFSKKQLDFLRAAGIYLDYQLIGGAIKLATRLPLPLVSTRAAATSAFWWSAPFRYSPLAIPLFAAVGHTHAIRSVEHSDMSRSEKTSMLRAFSQALVGTGPGVGSWTP